MKNKVATIVLTAIFALSTFSGISQSTFSTGDKGLSYKEYIKLKKEIEKEIEKEENFIQKKIDQKSISLNSINDAYLKDSLIEKYVEKDWDRVNDLKKQLAEIRSMLLSNGSENKFSGQSLSVRKGSEAYSTAMDANGRNKIYNAIANKIEKGSGAQINPTNDEFNSGLSGIIDNETYYNLIVKIYKKSGQIEKTFVVGPKSSKISALMPGEYYYTITINDRTSDKTFFAHAIAPEYQVDYKGNLFYWGILKTTY